MKQKKEIFAKGICFKKALWVFLIGSIFGVIMETIISYFQYGNFESRRGLIYGMGHAIYTLSDPRAVALKAAARPLAEQKGYKKEMELIELVERLTPKAFAEVKGSDVKVMCANVDMYSGVVYEMLGIPREMFTPLFATARISGWLGHRIEEVMTGGKIIRPAYKSISKKGQYIPIEKR